MLRDEWEFQQYEREETSELFGPSKAIWDPRMMVFAEVDGEPRRRGCRLARLDTAVPIAPRPGGPDRHADGVAQLAQDGACGLQGIAVLPEFRGRGIGAALLARFFAGLEEMGFSEQPLLLRERGEPAPAPARRAVRRQRPRALPLLPQAARLSRLP